MTERERFEAWYIKSRELKTVTATLFWLGRGEDNSNDFYDIPQTEKLWEAWQARANAEPEGFEKLIPELLEVLRTVSRAHHMDRDAEGNAVYKVELYQNRIDLLYNETAHKWKQHTAEQNKQTEWIPVTERLPEIEQWYAVICKGVVDTAWFQNGKFPPEVTHWLPLPPFYNPKEGEG